MGNKKSRVLEVDNIQGHLAKCQDLGRRDCGVYGPVHFVRYNGMDFLLGEAQTNNPPSSASLHYLAPPNLLIIPEFTLLEHSKPETVDELIDILVGVSELCRESDVGLGRGRVGFAGKWGIVGEKSPQWAYQEVFKDTQIKGVYLSPQLMLSLSQEKVYPKHNPKKSDVFSLGIMLLEIIFQQDLSTIFDYSRYEMKLKPLLEKLSTVKQHFGEGVYNILLRMVELQENDRATFEQLLETVAAMRNPNPQLARRGSTISQMSNNEYSSSRTPNKKKNSVVVGVGYNRNCSPSKNGGFADNIRTPERIGTGWNGKTPERSNISQQTRVSPLKRDLRINTRFDKENNLCNNGYSTNRSPAMRKQGVSPLSRR